MAESLEKRTLLAGTVELQNLSVTPGAEGESVALSGTVIGLQPTNNFTLDITWGDGASQQYVATANPAGNHSFNIPHQYAQNGNYTVNVQVTEAPLLVGTDAVFVVDVSGSTQSTFSGTSVGDLNGDGRTNTILDAEIAAFKALNQNLIDRGLGTIAQVSIVEFGTGARQVDMNPAVSGVQLSTTPLADNDNNGIRDVDQALAGLVIGGSTYYEAALQTVINTLQSVGSPAGTSNVIFISDGSPNPSSQLDFGDEANFIKNNLGQNLRAFGAGTNVPLNYLQQMDPSAVRFTSTNDLLNVFSGAGPTGGGNFSTSTTASIQSVAPVLHSLQATSPINENEFATLSGGITDPGTQDSFTLVVDWGDGLAPETFNYPAGTTSFSETHPYLDDGSFSIVVISLTDSDGQQAVFGSGTSVLTNGDFEAGDFTGWDVGINPVFSNGGRPYSIDSGGDGWDVRPSALNGLAAVNGFDGGVVDQNGAAQLNEDLTFFLRQDFSVTAPLESAQLTFTFDITGGPTIERNPTEDRVFSVRILDPTGSVLGVPYIYTVAAGTTDQNPAQTVQLDLASTLNALGAGTYTLEFHELIPQYFTGPGNFTLDNVGLELVPQVVVTVNNVAPALENLAVTSTIDENDVATLSGNIIDPGTQDSFTLVVDWGDGSAPETFNYPAGTTSFSETHQYLDDGMSPGNGTAADTHQVTILSLTDDDGGSAVLTQQRTVSTTLSGDISNTDFNNATSASFAPLFASELTFATQGIAHSHSSPVDVFVDVRNANTGAWVQVFQQTISGGGQLNFDGLTITFPATQIDGVRLRSNPGQNQTFHGWYTLSQAPGVELIFNENSTADVQVNNVAAELANVAITSAVNENGTATLTGDIIDPGTLDEFTLSIDWGDGSLVQTINLPASSTTFSVDHTYLDDAPTGTPTDNYSVLVSIIDDDSSVATTASTTVTVNNLDPVVALNPVTTIDESGIATLTGTITDASAGGQTVVDFAELAHTGFGVGPTFDTFASQGFTFYGFSGGLGLGGDANALTSMGSATTSAYPGSAALVNRFASGTTQLIQDSGASFNLISLGLSESNRDAGSAHRTITFVGTKADGSTVTHTVTTDGNFGLETVSFSDFTDLVSVHWQNPGSSLHIDDLVIHSGPSDTFTVEIDWDTSDPGSSTTTLTHDDLTFISPGVYEFTATHQYLDDDPTATNADVYTIGVTVVDDDTGSDSTTSTVTVNNLDPANVTLDAPVINEDGTATVTGSFTDVGTLDTHTVVVDWGDGSTSAATVDQTNRTFTASHQYLDDDPTGTASDIYDISATVTDDDGGTAFGTSTVTVNNVDPTIGTLNAPVINEDGTATITGSFSDVGTLDTHTVVIDWGDGSTSNAIVDPLSRTFTADHQYLDDDPTGTASDDYTIGVTLADDDTGVATASTTVTVNNVGPTIETVNVPVINEDGTATVTGSFSDVGTLDTHTVVIDWGDGSTSAATVDPATRTFTASHQYLDDDPSGTGSDVYDISVAVTDDDGGTALGTSTVTVNNVAPVVDASSVTISATVDNLADVGDIVSLSAAFADVGTLDTHHVTIDWGDGTSSNSALSQSDFAAFQGSGGGSGGFTAEHTYATGGLYTVTMTVIDDDGGSDSQTVQAVVSGVGLIDGILYVIGTEDRDHINVKSKKGQIEVDAMLSQGGGSGNSDRVKVSFPVADIQQIVISTFGGDDHVNLHHNEVDIPAIILGGTGNDHLDGGSAADVIVGGDGRDHIDGRGGNNVLIGGDGEDDLTGGDGEDLLIGGWTSYDEDLVGLNDLLSAWSATNAFSDRVDALQNGAGVSGMSLTGSTVFDDGDKDKADGKKAGDWFLGRLDGPGNDSLKLKGEDHFELI